MRFLIALLLWATAALAAPTAINLASQANGGVASASSSVPGYPPSGANNGDRRGLNWGNGGGWNDATGNAFPDWLQIDFPAAQSVAEIDVFCLQDNYTAPVDPTPSLVFTRYGITDFNVQYWTGSAWVDVPGGHAVGNTKVWRRFTFPAITTQRIRVLVNAAVAGYSRIVEVEAWNVAMTYVTIPRGSVGVQMDLVGEDCNDGTMIICLREAKP